jgi:hypothetical protein
MELIWIWKRGSKDNEEHLEKQTKHRSPGNIVDRTIPSHGIDGDSITPRDIFVASFHISFVIRGIHVRSSQILPEYGWMSIKEVCDNL